MTEPTQPEIVLARDELEIVTAALAARFPTKSGEDLRVADMHRMLRAASSLGRAVTVFTQHGLVHCRGTRGCTDLDADAAALFDALEAWCASVREVAARYPASIAAQPDDLGGLPGELPEIRFNYAS